MLEKLIEDWLTNVNELGYQIPFCETLVAEGYTVVHVSTHGRGEHGKDVVARQPDGVLATFQLKGGDIKLPEWRRIRDEVAELVQLPVRLPGVDEAEPHIPHLVTNGEIRGDALESITRYTDLWQCQNPHRLQVWSRRILLKKFIDAHGSFLPRDLREFRRFVELYAGDFESPLPKARLAHLLEGLAGEATGQSGELGLRRWIAALTLVAGYIAEQYERVGNYLAAAEGWTMAAAAIMHAVEREKLAPSTYAPSLALLYSSLVRTLDRFASEVLGCSNLSVSRYGLTDPYVYGVRVTLVLGWLSAWALDRRWRRGEAIDTERLFELITREYPARMLAGEVDWPFLMCLALYLDRDWKQADAEAVLINYADSIIRSNRGRTAHGAPSPYWSHGKVLRLAHGMLAPSEREDFGGQSYTLHQALDMLVRRIRRQALRVMWPRASKLISYDFVPDQLSDYFLWRCKAGNLRAVQLRRTASWSTWRSESAALDQRLVPSALVSNPEWVLPFLLTYPHRANRSLSALAEAVNARYVHLSAPRDNSED